MSNEEITNSKNWEQEGSVDARGRVYDNVLETIGATPMVRIPNFSKKYSLKAEIILKLEYFNPASSVKDRVGMAMINAAEKNGKITPGKTLIVEPTSGNTGIGLALVAAQKGYDLVLTMPENMSSERIMMLRYMGAKVILTSKDKGMQGAIDKAKEIISNDQNSFFPSQFTNQANAQIHENTTAKEIWVDTGGNVDFFVAGVGTGGVITGVSKGLKEKSPTLITVAVEPEESSVLSGGCAASHGIQGIGAGFVPEILDLSVVDKIEKINTDKAISTAKELAVTEGVICGISSGAAIAAAKEIALKGENQGKIIVVIVSSCAERYITTPLFEGI